MLVLNFKNIEQFVFGNKEVRLLLPDFSYLFNQWQLSQKTPALRQLGKRALMDFLNFIEQSHVEALESYFNTKVVIEKLDYHMVKNVQTAIDTAEVELDKEDVYSNLSISRKDKQLYISFWR